MRVRCWLSRRDLRFCALRQTGTWPSNVPVPEAVMVIRINYISQSIGTMHG